MRIENSLCGGTLAQVGKQRRVACALKHGFGQITWMVEKTKIARVVSGDFSFVFFWLSGEPCRNRTCDPLIKSQLLYQLS